MYAVFAASIVAVVSATPASTRSPVFAAHVANVKTGVGLESGWKNGMSEYFRKSLIQLKAAAARRAAMPQTTVAPTTAPPPEAVTRCFKPRMGMQAYKGFGLFTSPYICAEA